MYYDVEIHCQPAIPEFLVAKQLQPETQSFASPQRPFSLEGYHAYDLGIPIAGIAKVFESEQQKSRVLGYWILTPDQPAYHGLWGALEMEYFDIDGWGHALKKHPEAQYVIASMANYMETGQPVIAQKRTSAKYPEGVIFVTTPVGVDILDAPVKRQQLACVDKAIRLKESMGAHINSMIGYLRYNAGQQNENLLNTLILATELELDVWDVIFPLLTGTSASRVISSYNKLTSQYYCEGRVDWLLAAAELFSWAASNRIRRLESENPFAKALIAKPMIGFVSAANTLEDRNKVKVGNAMAVLKGRHVSSPSNVLTLRPMTAYSHVVYNHHY